MYALPAVESSAESGVMLRHTWHRTRLIIAQSSVDDLDPMDFQAIVSVRAVVGSAAPGDLSVFLEDDDPDDGRTE